MTNERGKNQITEGVIWRQLLLFFFPIVIGTLFQQLYNTVDAIIVGRFVGKEALAAVGGIGLSVSSLVIGFFLGLANGAAVIISQFYGAEDKKNLHKALHTAYAFSIIMGIAIAVVSWIIMPGVVKLMNTPTDVMEESVLYLRVYFLGSIATLIFNMGSAILRAIGDSRRPLYYLAVSCVLNIILDYVLVLIIPLGIAGAAIATILAQAVSAVFVTRALMKAGKGVELRLSDIRMDKSILRSEMRIGIPSGVQSCIYAISNVIIQAAINGFGTDAAAAWAAYGKLDAIFWSVCAALGTAVTTFVGQNYGAGKYKRVFRSVQVTLGMSAVLCGGLIIFLYMACRVLFSVFTTDAVVVDIGVYMLHYIMPTYIIYIFIQIYTDGLRGLGDVMIPTIITLGGVGLVRLPWVIFMTPIYNRLETVMISYPLSWTITAVLMIGYYFYKKRKILRTLEGHI